MTELVVFLFYFSFFWPREALWFCPTVFFVFHYLAVSSGDPIGHKGDKLKIFKITGITVKWWSIPHSLQSL